MGPSSGGLLGFVKDPAEVVGSTVDDRDCDYAGHLVRMLPVSAVHDLRNEAAPGAQGNAALVVGASFSHHAPGGGTGRTVLAWGRPYSDPA